ncbi:hypothetical protein [Paracoccus sp. S1E-3]|uniref:hypothetical protein n=1 Tax=Paracoccus sp. S1E-3 TaxID=2756130 RepID=UPI0015EF2120|nr:hypothetical protein [Paracoccus sp. S1E-3]MBA4491671.1 hypothetical protein [Paracoccus sp. S1E-3]
MIVTRHLHSLRTYAHLICMDRTRGDALLEHCLSEAIRLSWQKPPDADVLVWMLALMHRAYLTEPAFRRRRARRTVVLADDDPIHFGLFCLGAREREAIVLIDILGQSYRNSAIIQRSSQSGVWHARSRGRDTLRRIIWNMPSAERMRWKQTCWCGNSRVVAPSVPKISSV